MALRSALEPLGKEKRDWDIYRGDEFQVYVQQPGDAFETLILIKSNLAAQGFNARFSIGIGAVSYEGSSVRESNGEAFLYSGKNLDLMKEQKLQSMMIRTPNGELDLTLNLLLQYVDVVTQSWTANSAGFLFNQMKYRTLNQTQIAAQLSVTQGAYSRGLKRAHYELLTRTAAFFKDKISEL